MEFLILLILATASFYIIKRSVSKITTTPIWILWLSLMSPALIWTTWRILNPQQQSIPQPLILIPLLLSPFLYLILIEIGKPATKINHNSQENSNLNNTIDQEDKSVKKIAHLITLEEEKNLRNCFPWDIYYLQKIDYFPQAVICFGKLRTIPDNAYNIIKQNVEKFFNDRYLLIFQETIQGQPFFALVPNPCSESKQQHNDILAEKITRPWVALGLLLLTLITTTLIGTGFVLFSEITALMEQQKNLTFSNLLFNEILSNPSLLWKGLPYSLSLILILGVHELSHYFLAVYYRIKTTLPYFLPIPFFLGTFGAFISIKSPTPHRKALFDVAVAGPWGGFIASIPILIWGLALSDVVNVTKTTTMLDFQALDPRFSCLLAIISKIALGDKLGVGEAISLHPMAIAGYIGLIITALNLMPVGQLDGGHIIHAMLGQGKAVIIGQVTRFLMFVLALIRQEFLFWAILLLFMPLSDQPALNDVSELDNKRDFLGILSILLLVMILLPLPPTIAQWLNL